MQAAIGFPLTVYGTGGQTRAFIHIRDSVKCIELAIKNPPKRGDRVKIINQATEAHNIKWLAEKISQMKGTKIQFLVNPRIEAPENKLEFAMKQLISLGLSPITLNEGLMEEVINVTEKYKDRCNKRKILSRSKWRKDIDLDDIGSIE